MDYSKLTDNEINGLVERLIYPGTKIFYAGVYDNYVNDDGFCLRIVKENKMELKAVSNGRDYKSCWGWVVKCFVLTEICSGETVWADAENLNRAILETYLKIKEGSNEQ